MTFIKIGIIGAMLEEVERLQAQINILLTASHAGIDYIEGELHGKKVVICKCGVGKVNAAMCTQALIDFFQVDAVIFTGVAGALDPKLDIGDIVISTDCLQHDMDVSALGFPRGTIPFQETSVFAADVRLADLAYEASYKLFAGKTKRGRILTGDQFIARRETVIDLFTDLEGACTEMEGAATAQVCVMNTTAFVIIRSISDKANGEAPHNFAEFMKQAASNSFQIVQEMIKQIN